MNDQAIEKEIQAKGLTAPRITPADVIGEIASEHYFTAEQGAIRASYDNAKAALVDAQAIGTGVYSSADLVVPEPLKLLTFCVLVLKNGFTVSGESACASPENFDAEIGRQVARQNAINKIWPLLGFQLKELLHQAAAAA